MAGASNYLDVHSDLCNLVQIPNNDVSKIPIYVHMLVVSVRIGIALDMQIGCFFEMVIHSKFKTVCTVLPRTEECTTHIEIMSIFNADAAKKMADTTSYADGAVALYDAAPSLMRLNISISRHGEILYRLSFTSPIEYGKTENKWITDVCRLYSGFFRCVLESKFA